MRAAEALAHGALAPLFGIPFAIKDNIDAVYLPTTAGCPAFSYVAEQDATTVWTPQKGRRNPDRQNKPGSICNRPRRRAVTLRSVFYRLSSGVYLRRVQFGLGCGCGRGSREFCFRNRHGRFRTRSGGIQQHRRPETDKGYLK